MISIVEWIVCDPSCKYDPRVAKAIEVAEVSEDRAKTFEEYLIRKNLVAFKMASYCRHFKDRCDMRKLPRRHFK